MLCQFLDCAVNNKKRFASDDFRSSSTQNKSEKMNKTFDEACEFSHSCRCLKFFLILRKQICGEAIRNLLIFRINNFKFSSSLVMNPSVEEV